MGDVYVEAGDVRGVDNKYLSNAKAGLQAAVKEAANKANSGLTTVKPGGGKGIRVNVIVRKLAQDGNNVTCSLIGELKELPGMQPFNPKGSAVGEGTVPGKIDAVAGDCVKKAAADMLDKVGSAIATSQAAPAAPGKSPLIFIAPVEFKDASGAQQDLKDKMKAAVLDLAKKKIEANPKRFTMDPDAFKQGSGMPAYVLNATVIKFAFDPTNKQMVVQVKVTINEHLGGKWRSEKTGDAVLSGFSRPPKEADRIQVLRDAAERAIDKAIEWMLKEHP